jgi:hypothetical protein
MFSPRLLRRYSAPQSALKECYSTTKSALKERYSTPQSALKERYSTPQSALKKLWVKHNGAPSTQVPIKGCTDIDDFAEKVKQKLNTNCQVALFSSLDKEALDPGLTINELLKTEDVKNTSKIPLFVKLIPATQDSMASMTIYIRDMDDDDGVFADEYIPVTVKNDKQLRSIYKNGKGLICLTGPKKLIVSFDEIEDGKKYQVYMYSQDFAGWQKKDADAMEAETLLSMKAFLMEKFQALPINLPTDFLDEKGRQIQEWDGILLSKDTLYLLEAKHAMTDEKIETIAERVKQFPKMIKRSDFNVKYSKIVGVACGTLFPIDCREEAHRLGLMVVYPSGSRYRVDEKYTIE